MADAPSSGSVACLTVLPDELKQHIFSYLSAVDIAAVSQTCRVLYQQAQEEKLWQELINDHLPKRLEKPGMFESFQRLYSAHHPYWFLPKNKIWFSDFEYTGQLIIARYDHRRGVIEAFRLVAGIKEETFSQWSANPEVIIQSFNPQVRLWMDDPVIEMRNAACLPPRDRQYSRDYFKMSKTVQGSGPCSSFVLCRGNVGKRPPIRNDFLWPPVTIPSEKSLRRSHEMLKNEKSGMFLNSISESENPTAISDTSFYIRKWLHFGLSQPMIPSDPGDQLSTYATLSPELYAPTKEKPFQGIWVGDYNFHGCEFLLFLQRDAGSIAPLGHADRSQFVFSNGVPGIHTAGLHNEHEFERASLPNSAPSNDAEEHNGMVFRGRLEGIKLTGDPNIPRGEISFVAEDIGPSGTIGIAEDDEFRGARVVRSKGHIAFQQYTDDRWVETELFLISPDCVAQYWKPMRHVSFFRRVNIDQYTNI
ncbi:F-box domain protein [Talaromyces proteolyticus]|uniref:F-box domain protein n=1 Tax=Talaromyces proteolyticus TaxID=1131652 RepID=A0AAD4Q2X9_9EURO|nr:F-box domain protein [Talaromyces proteolyticus]KAH8700852.1 F-box domain protein [Talaromyces proteolyticus]